MKIQYTRNVLYIGIILFTVSCHTNRDKKSASLAPNAQQVIAEEVIQTSSYTYVRVSADERNYWIAINKSEVIEGKTYYWSDGIPMKDFPSKELNRTFSSIFLVQDFTDQPITLDNRIKASSGSGIQKIPQKSGIVIEPVEGGTTIAELYSLRDMFAGQKVKIRGEVVKFSGGIMNRNWVHIQDGTKFTDQFDLAVTTSDTVKVGDLVVFEGLISLNKDFGAGYFYDLIMEDASLTSKNL